MASVLTSELNFTVYEIEIGLPGDSVVKNPPANAGAEGLTPGLGRSPGEEMATHSRILAWRIPWSLADYSPWGHRESDTTKRAWASKTEIRAPAT